MGYERHPIGYRGQYQVRRYETKITKQRTELDRAIERAMAAGLEVVAHGYRKSNPSIKIYSVPSQTEANRWHVVSLYGSHLVCDCKSRVICAHRAAVHMELVIEAAKQAMHAAEIEGAFETDVQATCAEMEPSIRCATSVERVNAMLARIEADRAALNRSPKLGDDQRVFSLYK